MLNFIGGRIKQTGFTLIEIAIVLVIAGLLTLGGVKLLAATVKNKQYADTRNNLETVNAALVQFVSREKRLPCPADGIAGTGDELRTPGVPATCNNAQLNGVVPWRALGLTQSEASDGWYNRITYRVSPELVNDNAMNFADCDPAGAAPAIGGALYQKCQPIPPCGTPGLTCTPVNAVLLGKGLTVANLAGAVQANAAGTTGAAYVLISHGENVTGAYNANGVLVTGSPLSGSAEIANANNRVVQTSPSPYFADNFNATAAPSYFDDIVLYKTVHWVVGQARLDARSH